tara:strand:+ start:2811 stop:3038 length:228 start_codon:yes stop_codon:yes gene_type:complete
MWIDKLAVYKYDRPYSENKKQRPLKLQNHLINDEMMKVSKLSSLLESLQEAWGCTYDEIQIQVRFVPEGTDRDEQ